MENNEKQPANEPVKTKRRRSRRMKNSGCAGTVVYVIAVLGISVVLSLIAIFVANDVFAFVKDDAEIQIDVSENTDILSLAKELDDTGVLNYQSVFKFYVKIKKDNTSVLAGAYKLNPTMDYGQIIRTLANTTSEETVKITIPEGYTVGQIKKLLVENNVCTEQAADAALSNYPFKHEFLKEEMPVEEGWLEGYLFPDTYEIYRGNSAVVDAVNKMINTFDDKYSDEIKAGAEAQGRSMHEILTIASLIEREAQHDDEYAKIAGVIYNRLNNSDSFPYLQVDASVLYGLDRVGGTLSTEDLEKDTPYNTYTQRGLPPGPICNPGMKSIRAAAYPEDHNYFYYVAMPDGSHLFANSNDEHNNNIAVSNAAQAEAAQSAGGEGE